MVDIHNDLHRDMEAVRQIPVVPTMLEVICQITGMGFAAVARVTEDRWLACYVRDEANFGLKEGDELKIETTLCNEIRNSRQPIIISCVAEDICYKNHHTPNIYGLQSYISFPIILKNGEFFGTICAIDSKPANINNTKVKDTFTMFADLLAFHLESMELLDRSYKANLDLHQKNKVLTSVNNDLDTFVYSASHDLKSPLTNLFCLVENLTEEVNQENLDRKEIKKLAGLMKSSLKRFEVTVKDLTTFIQADENFTDSNAELISLPEIVEDVKQELTNLIVSSNARIKVSSAENVQLYFPRKSFKSIIYNLLSNALKYKSPDREPEILVQLNKVSDKITLTVSDNGLGIPEEKLDNVFTMFKRFHSHVEGSGLGLYIVKRLVENNQGHVQVTSTLNVGTTFTINFK